MYFTLIHYLPRGNLLIGALVPRRHLLLPTAAEVGKSAASRSRWTPLSFYCSCITQIIPVSAIRPSRNRGEWTASERPTLSFMNPRFICGDGIGNDRSAAPFELTSMFRLLRRLSDGRFYHACVYVFCWRIIWEICLLKQNCLCMGWRMNFIWSDSFD